MRKIQLVLCFICVTAVVLHGGTTVQLGESSKEEEFLKSPDVAICELKKTTISSMDFPRSGRPSFIHRMKSNNEEDLRYGSISFADREFKILLGKEPKQQFCLYDVKKGYAPYWWGSWNLYSKHKINGKYYELLLVEGSTKLAARPYLGEAGVIRVGKGGRALEKVQFNGSLRNAQGWAVPVGTVKKHWTDPVAECSVPVGDYTAYTLAVTYDNLKINISDNYHINAKGQSRKEKKTVYGFTIRKDRPYVLDFSTKPVVVFDEPKPDKTRFKAGEEIKFAALLLDPELDIMIRGLDDTSVKVEKEAKFADGSTNKYEASKSLDPKIVISRSNGEIVAEGTMPFG
jgi:hypothetical protein